MTGNVREVVAKGVLMVVVTVSEDEGTSFIVLLTLVVGF